MSEIRKIDFYCGAFLSYLVTNKIAPTLFEAGDNSKIVNFETNHGYYKVYIKYSTLCKRNEKTGARRWNIYFTDNEMVHINRFSEPKKKLLFVLVCTDADMKDNEIAVIDYKDGLTCLGNDPVNKVRRISILHKKSSPNMTCYGTALDEKEGKMILRDYNKYFLEKAE